MLTNLQLGSLLGKYEGLEKSLKIRKEDIQSKRGSSYVRSLSLSANEVNVDGFFLLTPKSICGDFRVFGNTLVPLLSLHEVAASCHTQSILCGV